MLALVLALTLSAPPRVHPAASVALYLPRPDKLSEVTPFFKAAGKRSTMLDPLSWRGELHPLLFVDATQPESLAAVGIDPAGSITVNLLGSTRLTCTRLKSPALFEKSVAARLSGAGTPWNATASGASLVGVTLGGRVLAGYAIRGNEACAARGPNLEVTLKDAAQLMTSGAELKALAGLPGALFVITPEGVVGLKGTEARLTAEGRATRLPLPPLSSAGSSPYATMTPSGLAFVRARIAPAGRAAVLDTLSGQFAQLCGAGCDRALFEKLSRELAPLLTGNVLLRIDGVKVRSSLRESSARYFAVRHAWLAEVTQPAQVKSSLAALAALSLASPTEEGFALKLTGGEIQLGVHGRHLYIANDAEALRVVLEAVPETSGRLAHGADFVLDPRRVAQGLSQVGLLDVVGSQELAGLFAVGTELGPLLSASEQLAGWADSTENGGHRFQSFWALKPPATLP